MERYAGALGDIHGPLAALAEPTAAEERARVTLASSRRANLPGQQRQRAATAATGTAATAATAACATSARIARPGFVDAAGAPDWAGWAGQRPAIGRPG